MAEGLAVLLSVSLSGACLMAAAEGISRLLGRRISPGIRRILWMVVLVRLLCPWSPSGGLLDRAAELPETAWSSSVRTAAEGAAEETQVSHAAAADPSTELPLEAGLTALWGAGLCGVMVRRGVGYARLCRGLSRTQRPAGALPQAVYARLTAAERHPPALLVSGAAPCPMLLGLVRPKIVLPDGKLSQEELEGVLAHELTHWRRRDLWLKWLAALAAAVHWFDPAAWLLLDRLDRDCELSCDQAVVRGWSGPQRARYGELLLRLAAGEELPSIALFSQKQRLKERLISIMEERNDGRKKRWKKSSCPGGGGLPGPGAHLHGSGGLHRPCGGGGGHHRPVFCSGCRSHTCGPLLAGGGWGYGGAVQPIYWTDSPHHGRAKGAQRHRYPPARWHSGAGGGGWDRPGDGLFR